MTDPGWVFLLATASGVISEKGSLLSHTSIISRELKIPSIVGVNNLLKNVPSKKGNFIQGVKIVGDRHSIVQNVEKYNIDTIIIAIPTASKKNIKEMLKEM